ncbi:MAG: RtcB family protein [Anaerolineae bacterium]|nr:RtcB family protein [Anaerolineae bacterium]
MFTPEEKAAINQRLTESRVKSKKLVFDLINKGDSTYEQVDALISQLIADQAEKQKPSILRKSELAEYKVFGRPLITQNAIDDMNSIMSMPFVLGGALMPDGHRVAPEKPPVGSVIVCDAVVPAYVGADISCSVNLTMTNMVVNDDWFDEALPSIQYVLKNKARFGLEIQPDPIVFDMDFYNQKVDLKTEFGKEVYEHIKKIARNHFGTCGDGNHFFEFGYVPANNKDKGQRHLAMLSHFGSRAVGSTIASAYEGLANDMYELPKGVKDAPLDPTSSDGQDYIALMNWAGDFAEAGHKWLHVYLMEQLAERVDIAYSTTESIFSRHNSMWITNDGYVHRKGATPADHNQKGVIPATMGHATQIITGLGNPESFNSASHGGGRTHSRGQALQAFSNTHEYVLHEAGVTLIGGDADEDPRAYKDIYKVMAAQSDCAYSIGQFYPKVVRMAEPRLPWWKTNKGKK